MVKRRETVIKHREINPVVSAALNFIIWGTGYIYNGRRLVLGIGLLLGMIIVHSPVFYLGIKWYLSFPGMLVLIGHMILSLIFAYDGYSDSRD